MSPPLKHCSYILSLLSHSVNFLTHINRLSYAYFHKNMMTNHTQVYPFTASSSFWDLLFNGVIITLFNISPHYTIILHCLLHLCLIQFLYPILTTLCNLDYIALSHTHTHIFLFTPHFAAQQHVITHVSV